MRIKVKGERIKVKGLLILSIFIFQFSICVAQSNVTFPLHIGATGEVTLLEDFPETFAGEKVNITLADETYLTFGTLEKLDALKTLDYFFADQPVANLSTWGDSVYSYTDTAGVAWTVWRTHRRVKNTLQNAKTQNAYKTFEGYLKRETGAPSLSVPWLGWLCAGLLLLAGIIYVCVILIQRRREKNLTSVEQEILRRKRMGLRRHYGSQLYLWLLLLVLYAPIALIAVFSFTKSKVLGNWTGFSFDLYLNLFTGKADAGLNSAIWYTVVIALVAAVVSTVLGTLAAIGIYNMRARHRKMVSFLNSVPMINPDIITGISLFLLFVALGMSQGLATVCIAHVVFCTPYVVLSVLPRLSRMNPNTYEAALDLGATPAQALRMVMLPELWPGMISGFILALTLSVDDFGVTFFTKGSGGLETLSTFIYSDARKGGLTPELRPLFTIILIVMLAVLIYINIRNSKQEEK
jgi:spermidine/putrescine transport system permease protein